MNNFKLNSNLSQVFLKNDIFCEKITSYINSDSNSYILEIGPGLGSITRHLFNIKHKELLLIELDKRFISYLKNNFKEYNFDVKNEDILKYNLNENETNIYIIGNIPFNITYPIFQKFIDWKNKVKEIVIIIQDEVARKVFKVGGKGYGPITVLMQLYYEIELKDLIEAKNFNPIPGVNSRIIKFIRKRDNFSLDDKLELEFRKFLEIIFKYPRKNLKNNLKGSIYSNLEIIKNIEEKRAQEFTPIEILNIFFKINKLN